MITFRNIYKTFLVGCCIAAAAAGLTACSEDDLSRESVVKADQVEYTPFDYWLQRNYVEQHMKSSSELNQYYLKTIHHEFTHILNQTKDFPADFQLITGSGYVADKWSTESYTTGYLPRGFISNYAQHSPEEDFAEMLSFFVCNSELQWQQWMKQAGAEGERLITAKLDVVIDYMLTTFGIDLVKLRAAIQRRQGDLTSGRLDLMDLEK